MRTSLLLLATILLGLLAWLALRTRADSTPAPVVVQRPGSAVAIGDGSGVPAPGESPTVPETLADVPPTAGPAHDPGRQAALAERPDIEWNQQRILGALVARTSALPIPGYSILVVPSGQDPEKAGILPAHQRATTDALGLFELNDLREPGPWDVYAFPRDLGLERTEAWQSARVGSITARNVDDAERTTFQIIVGPLVTLESPLPEGVEPDDVWFELIDDGPHRSVVKMGVLGKPVLRNRRFVQGRASEDGKVVADLPWPGGMGLRRSYVVRVVTEDGRFGLLDARETSFTATDPWRIQRPLEPRGKVQVHLSLEDLRNEAPTEADWLEAITVVPWRLLQDDPSRSDTGLMVEARTIRWNRRWRRTGPATFELHDLPLSTPIEIGPRGGDTATKWEAGALQADSLVRTTAVHGDPEPVEVRVRRVR